MRSLLLFACTAFLISLPLRGHAADETIKVGVLTSLSDDWAAVGQATVRAIELALNEIHSRGGISGRKVELVSEDTREAHSGTHTITAYRNLRQRGIKWFIGPAGTGGALALAPIVATEDILIISPTVGVRNFSEAGTNIFNTRGVDEYASAYMAREGFGAGWRKAAVLASQQPWDTAQGEAFSLEFERLGGRIARREAPLSDANDLKPMLMRMIATKPDGIFLANYSRIGVTAKQLRQLGYTGPKISTALDSWAIESTGGSLDGAQFASFAGPTESFTSKFRAKYSQQPSLGADAAYDAMIALAKALEENPDDSIQAVSKRLANVQFEGAAGAFSFDNNRVAKRELKRFIVREGRLEPWSSMKPR
jgi:branched-chain amino acid transport system substrate-binding protein